MVPKGGIRVHACAYSITYSPLVVRTISHSLFVRCSCVVRTLLVRVRVRCSRVVRTSSHERELTRELRSAPVWGSAPLSSSLNAKPWIKILKYSSKAHSSYPAVN